MIIYTMIYLFREIAAVNEHLEDAVKRHIM